MRSLIWYRPGVFVHLNSHRMYADVLCLPPAECLTELTQNPRYVINTDVLSLSLSVCDE